jgi:hypothetical protein
MKTSRELSKLKIKELKKECNLLVNSTLEEEKTNEFYLKLFLLTVQVQALESNLNYKFKNTKNYV